MAAAAAGQSSPQSSVLPDHEIRKILVERIDAQQQSVGIVVGAIEPTGRRIVTYGRSAKGDGRPLDGDTRFEIGSITKVFTHCCSLTRFSETISHWRIRSRSTCHRAYACHNAMAGRSRFRMSRHTRRVSLASRPT
jgi:hypothetical protein